jgi:hypothetical protein
MNIVQRSLEIINAANSLGITLRLLGGNAVAILSYPTHPKLERVPNDIDLIGYGKESSRIIKLMTGFAEPDKRFNALHGQSRLRFIDGELKVKIDVFLDIFRESHVLPLGKRLGFYSPTVPPSDLLMTKLQIWAITEKDLKDIAALLLKLNLGEIDSRETISIKRIIELTSSDWGLYKTSLINLGKVLDYVRGIGIDGIEERVSIIASKMESSPKSIKWRLRSLIGERIKWYEEPEEA